MILTHFININYCYHLNCNIKTIVSGCSHRDMTKHRQYWLSQFKDEVPILSYRQTDVRPNIKTTNGAMMTFTMNQQMRQLLQKYVEKHQITDFMFFMSVVMTLLSRYARKDDVVVGSVMSARMHKGTEQMLGMFANTLVYRGQPSPDKMWTQFLQEVKENEFGGIRASRIPIRMFQ